MRSRLNLFACVNLTYLKCFQIEKKMIFCFYPEQMDPIEHNYGFSCIHSRGIFFRDFSKSFFGRSFLSCLNSVFFGPIFRLLRFCLNIWVQKSCRRCLSTSIKLPKYPDGRTENGRTSYGHRNLNGSHTKALRAIIATILVYNVTGNSL